MPDQKKHSSIFSFSKKQKSFLKWTTVFFTPVVLLYVILEVLVLQIPYNYTKISDYMNSEGESVKVLITGSSQMKCAVNPEFFTVPAINFGSTSQHHNSDYNIITQTRDRLPNVEHIVLELSYSHLELPHNSTYFWKNNVYLKYYGVNNFDRKVYFKDKLIFLSRPDIYGKSLYDYYVKDIKSNNFNSFGFDEQNFAGVFKRLDYNEEKIPRVSDEINTIENLYLFEKNTEFLYKIIDYLRSQKINTVIVTLPMHKYYLKNRNNNILRRRDSILEVISEKYPNVKIFRKEEDTINFKTSDYINHNHLNPIGAKKFTEALQDFINEKNFPK